MDRGAWQAIVHGTVKYIDFDILTFFKLGKWVLKAGT